MNYLKYRPFFQYYKLFAEGKPIENYIPDIFMWNRIEPYYYDCLKAKYYDDKNLYDVYFGFDTVMPKTIIHINNGFYLDGNYRRITRNDAINKCLAEGRIVIKPSVSSCGGRGIIFWDKNSNDKQILEKSLNNKNIIVQAFVEQHEELSHFHPSSVNTIRMISFAKDGNIKVLSSVLRMGSGGSCVDNVSSGGVFCGISGDGELFPVAYNAAGNKFYRHPTTGAVFKGSRIPSYERCKKMVCDNAGKFCNVSTIISWDVSVAPDGSPILIEFNLTFGGISSHQITRGPLFGDDTDSILLEVRG